MKDIEEKIISELEIVEEAIKDWRKGVLSNLSALVAIQITVTNQKPSKEMIEWAIEVAKKHMEEK